MTQRIQVSVRLSPSHGPWVQTGLHRVVEKSLDAGHHQDITNDHSIDGSIVKPRRSMGRLNYRGSIEVSETTPTLCDRLNYHSTERLGRLHLAETKEKSQAKQHGQSLVHPCPSQTSRKPKQWTHVSTERKKRSQCSSRSNVNHLFRIAMTIAPTSQA